MYSENDNGAQSGYERVFNSAIATRQDLQGVFDGKRRYETIIRGMSGRNVTLFRFRTGKNEKALPSRLPFLSNLCRNGVIEKEMEECLMCGGDYY